ncbi:MAG TPA: hypothetical protein VMB21_03225 [Candidatus Limnocylindria bacterium]|nr:hypothetical protein [Candidatus Limnocylindria bacterium]
MLTLLALSLAGAGYAQTEYSAGDQPNRFGGQSPLAVFAEQMRTEELMPPAALQQHELWTVDLRCRVGPGGTLFGCLADWESKPDVGLCRAALAAADRTRLKDHFADGQSLEGLYASVTMVFDTERIYPHLQVLSKTDPGPLGHPLELEPHGPPKDCEVPAAAVI